MIIKQAVKVQVRVKLNLEYTRKLCGFLLVQFRAGVGDFDVKLLSALNDHLSLL
jgi:hypothetical protein